MSNRENDIPPIRHDNTIVPRSPVRGGNEYVASTNLGNRGNIRVLTPDRTQTRRGTRNIMGTEEQPKGGFKEPMRQNEVLKERINELKQELLQTKEELTSSELQRKGNSFTLSNLTEQNNRLKLENENMKSMTVQTQSEQVDKNRRPKDLSSKFADKVPIMFQEIATNDNSRILEWCDKETKEIEFVGEPLRRNWNRRSEQGMQNGIDLSNGSKIIPTASLRVAAHRSSFTPSLRSEKDMMLMIVNEELNSMTWASHFVEAKHRIYVANISLKM